MQTPRIYGTTLQQLQVCVINEFAAPSVQRGPSKAQSGKPRQMSLVDERAHFCVCIQKETGVGCVLATANNRGVPGTEGGPK